MICPKCKDTLCFNKEAQTWFCDCGYIEQVYRPWELTEYEEQW
jgi:hypothetical protein